MLLSHWSRSWPLLRGVISGEIGTWWSVSELELLAARLLFTVALGMHRERLRDFESSGLLSGRFKCYLP